MIGITYIWKAKINFAYMYLLFKHDKTIFSKEWYLPNHFPST